MDFMLLGVAIGGGVFVGLLIVVIILLRRPKRERVDSFEVLEVEDEEHPFSVAKPAPPAPPKPPARSMLPPLPDNEGGVPTEWARRHVGPLEPDRVRGICSGCGTTISVSNRRPIRVACPVCGRTRLLS